MQLRQPTASDASMIDLDRFETCNFRVLSPLAIHNPHCHPTLIGAVGPKFVSNGYPRRRIHPRGVVRRNVNAVRLIRQKSRVRAHFLPITFYRLDYPRTDDRAYGGSIRNTLTGTVVTWTEITYGRRIICWNNPFACRQQKKFDFLFVVSASNNLTRMKSIWRDLVWKELLKFVNNDFTPTMRICNIRYYSGRE